MVSFHARRRTWIFALLVFVGLFGFPGSAGASDMYPIDEPLTIDNLPTNLNTARLALSEEATERAIEICDVIIDYVTELRETRPGDDSFIAWLDDMETVALGTKADSFLTAGDPLNAIDFYDAAIAISPLDSNLFYFRSQAHYFLGDGEKALGDMIVAINAFPWEIEYYNTMYFLRNHLGLDPTADVKLLHQWNLLFSWQDFSDTPIARAIPEFTGSIKYTPDWKSAYYQVLAYPDGSIVIGDFVQVGEVVSGLALYEDFKLMEMPDKAVTIAMGSINVIAGEILIRAVETEFFMVDGGMMGTFVYRIHYEDVE